ncbi:hypothetical protein BKA93DRAFT_785658 [Sparassis latifolia]
MPRRPPNIVLPTAPATPYSLAILSEYTHTLDSLPLDLSRNFADLRELDAVLSLSMSMLTNKITQLTSMIENNTASKVERLQLLMNIAEEAHRLKLGGEDKIRVACYAADGLRGHRAHMRMLLAHMPDVEYDSLADRLGRRTVFPHVATRTYYPLGMTEGGRRQRRGAVGSLLTGAAVEATPNKRKRVNGRDEDLDVSKSPRKERAADNSRQRNTVRTKRTERAASPAESTLSVASHMPQSSHLAMQSHTTNSRQNGHGRAPSTASASNSRRARASRTTPDALAAQLDSAASRRDVFNAPPSSSASHPSLPIPYAPNELNAHGLSATHLPNSVSEWAHGQLEGPGMPVARNFVSTTSVVAETVDAGAGAGVEVDGDPDDGKTYCFCDGVSYGDMIACDDKNCEREWFHLPCIGLTVPPDGTWYCDACRAKRNKQRGGRGGKKRTGGARAGARNTS